jgi:hypothetical protein
MLGLLGTFRERPGGADTSVQTSLQRIDPCIDPWLTGRSRNYPVDAQPVVNPEASRTG